MESCGAIKSLCLKWRLPDEVSGRLIKLFGRLCPGLSKLLGAWPLCKDDTKIVKRDEASYCRAKEVPIQLVGGKVEEKAEQEAVETNRTIGGQETPPRKTYEMESCDNIEFTDINSNEETQKNLMDGTKPSNRIGREVPECLKSWKLEQDEMLKKKDADEQLRKE